MNSYLLSQLAKAHSEELLRRAEERRRVVASDRSERWPAILSRISRRARPSEPAGPVDRWLAQC